MNGRKPRSLLSRSRFRRWRRQPIIKTLLAILAGTAVVSALALTLTHFTAPSPRQAVDVTLVTASLAPIPVESITINPYTQFTGRIDRRAVLQRVPHAVTSVRPYSVLLTLPSRSSSPAEHLQVIVRLTNGGTAKCVLRDFVYGPDKPDLLIRLAARPEPWCRVTLSGRPAA